MRLFILSILLLVLAAAGPETARPYLRTVEGPGGLSLQTCIRRLIPEADTGPIILLTAAYHIGTPEYYEALQGHLARKPLVLFEGAGIPDFLRTDPPGSVETRLLTRERLLFLQEWLERYEAAEGKPASGLAALKSWAERTDPGHAWMVQRTVELPGQPPLHFQPTHEEQRPAVESADGQRLELPARKENKPRSTDRSTLQRELAVALGLSFQLDCLRIPADRASPCDMTRSEMEAVLAASAGEGPGSAAGTRREKEELARDLDRMIDLMQGQGLAGRLARFAVGVIGWSESLRQGCLVTLAEIMDATGGDLIAASRDPRVRRLMTLLLRERNQLVLRALAARLRQPDPPRAIALFYGAGHMRELEEAIRQDFGYRPAGEAWLTVYTADPEVPGFRPEDRRLLRSAIMEQLQNQNPDL